MGSYKVTLRRSAIKDLRKLPKDVALRIEKQIDLIANNPRMRGVKKLSGEESYRLRVGDYRIVFDIYDDTRELDILFIQHRSQIYRNF